MTSLKCTESILNIYISNGEKISFNNVKIIVRKSRRMIQQNKATSVILELEGAPRINKNVLEYFKRVLCYNNSFPVAIINS